MSAISGTRVSSNDENVCPEDVRGKFIPRPIPPTKRVALSTINENVLKLPSCAQNGFLQLHSNNVSDIFSSTAFVPPKSKQKFTIYEEVERQESLSKDVIFLCKESDFSLHDQYESDDSYVDISTKKSVPRDDQFLCLLYSTSIYAHLRHLEVKLRPSPNYMKKQPDITSSMRSILVDWLVEVAEEYKMHTETLYLAVSYTDRFLSMMSVLRCKLQLVGTASMYIAAKYEEIFPPELREFVYITDDTYSKKQILRMEHLILKVLAFDLSTPTAYTFLQLFCSVMKVPEKVYNLAQYLCELTLLEAQPFLMYLPSEIASAALCLASYNLHGRSWSSDIQNFTGYSIEDFKECIENISHHHKNVDTYPQQAIKEKYKSSRYNNVSEIRLIEGLVLAS